MKVRIYANNPNPKEVRRVADILREGGIAVIPTDTLYAFVCSMDSKKSVETIARLKGYKLKQAKYSMMCASVSQVSEFVRPMNKQTFALVKEVLPGPFTLIMDANNNVPRSYQNANKTIGIRVSSNPIATAIVEELGCPIICTSVRNVNQEQETEYITDPELIHDTFEHLIDIVVDGGMGESTPSTVINCSNGLMEIVRSGKGEIEINT